MKITPILFVDEIEPSLEFWTGRLGFQNVEVAMPERKTFYGMREIVVREPGGNLVCFAARSKD